MAATARVSITSVQASSAENAGGIMHISLHSHVPSLPAPRQEPFLGPGSSSGSWGPPHFPSPGPHLQVLLCAGAPHGSLDAFPQARSAPGSVTEERGSTTQGRAPLAADSEVRGETHGSSGDGDGAASVRGATEQTLTLRKLPVLHHGGFVHLALSEPGRNTDAHSHHPWAEWAPESVPGLTQPSGCSGHPSCSSNPAKQKRYKTSRS